MHLYNLYLSICVSWFLGAQKIVSTIFDKKYKIKRNFILRSKFLSLSGCGGASPPCYLCMALVWAGSGNAHELWSGLSPVYPWLLQFCYLLKYWTSLVDRVGPVIIGWYIEKEKVLKSCLSLEWEYEWCRVELTVRKWLMFYGHWTLGMTHGCRTVKQFWRGVQRPAIWQNDHKASPIKGSCIPKSNMWGFWTFWTLKLTNCETRFWTRDTCHVDSEDTMWKPLSSRWF